MNAYDEACERFDKAGENYRKVYTDAEQMKRDADDEYEAAYRNLRQYEESPGLPLPQFRTEVPA